MLHEAFTVMSSSGVELSSDDLKGILEKHFKKEGCVFDVNTLENVSHTIKKLLPYEERKKEQSKARGAVVRQKPVVTIKRRTKDK